MPFASALTEDEDDSACLPTDDFDERTTSPHDGGYFDGNGWTVSDNTLLPWGGSSVAAYVAGGAGILEIYGPSDTPSYPLGPSNVSGQQSFMNWGYDAVGDNGGMDVLTEIVMSRQPLPETTHFGDPDWWGEYFWMFYGDGPPFTGGKFVVLFSGSNGMQIYLWDDGMSPADAAHFVPIPVDMTRPFKVRTTCAGLGADIEVRVWQSSGSEPVAPSMVVTAAQHVDSLTYNNHGFTVELTTNLFDTLSRLQLRMDVFDVGGLDSCDLGLTTPDE